MDRKATQRSSRQTKRPGSSPSMMRVKMRGHDRMMAGDFRRHDGLGRATCRGRRSTSTGSSPSPTSSRSSGWPSCRCSCGCCSPRTTRPRRPRLLAVPRGHRLPRRLHRPPLPPGLEPRQGARPGRRPLLFFVGGGAILIDGPCRSGSPSLVLVREVARGRSRRSSLAAMGARRIDVTWCGKAGTFCLMVAFPLFLASESSLEWPAWARPWGWRDPRPGAQLLRRLALRPARPERALAEARSRPGTVRRRDRRRPRTRR